MVTEKEKAKREYELNTWFQESVERIVKEPRDFVELRKQLRAADLALILNGLPDAASLLGYAFSRLELEAIRQGLEKKLSDVKLGDE